MRLNSALVSSFLFVSVSLADPHREKQQPPFLNRVEKSIDPTTIFGYIPGDEPEEAGAVWYTQGNIEAIAGTFTVPSANSRSVLKAFAIQVSIGGYYPDCGLGVGILVTTDGMNGAQYAGYSFWSPGKILPAPMGFSIEAGNVIGASVHMFHSDSKTGLVVLTNRNTRQYWVVKFRGQSSCPNRWDAEWIIRRSNSAKVKVPNFYAVTFSGMIVQDSGLPKVPEGQIILMNLEEDNRTITSVSVYRDFLNIRYNTDG